jgi:hypothetical protein
MPNPVVIPGIGPVVFVDREQLRFKRHGRTFGYPYQLPTLMSQLPTPPATFSGSMSRAIKFPVLGNNSEGDCFYVAPLHWFQVLTGNVSGPSNEAKFDTQTVLRRYEQLSGGDNGLGDQDVEPEMKKGMVGPNGPYTIIDWMTINPNDDTSIRFACWKFYGVMYTASLLTGWLNATSPGTYWTGSMGRADPRAGHAMLLSGFDFSSSKSYYEDETWGIDPAIRLTPDGLKASQPEIIVCFSKSMFDPTTGLAPDGESYEQKAAWWVACGGSKVPPSPFPPAPTPPIPPVDAISWLI